MDDGFRILGIDPGSRVTGFGIIEIQPGDKIRCMTEGCIRLQGEEVVRLGTLWKEIETVVATFRPQVVAIEQIFVHKNALSALKLGQARGAAIAACVREALPVYSYAPRQIKLAVTGIGSAEKSQVQRMIQVLLALQKEPQKDAADALAVALCHWHTREGIGISSRSKRRRRWRGDWAITRHAG